MENDNKISGDKYKALFVSSRDAVMTLEPPSWKFTTANPATVAMFGAKNQADFLSYPPWELSPKLQPDGSSSMGKAMEMIDEAMQNGSNLFEWTHRRVTGEDFPAEVLLSKVDEDGKAYLHAVVRDITQRKKLEEKVRQSAEEKFEIIFNSVNDGILLAETTDRKFSIGNNAICKMLGYTQAELKNLSVSDIHPVNNLSTILEQFHKQQIGELELIKDIPVKRKDGSIFYADINASNVSIGGKNYNLGVFRDSTDRKKAEDKFKDEENLLKESQLLAKMGNYVLDVHRGHWVSSEGLDALFGIDEKYERTVDGWANLIHPEDRAMMLDYLKNEVLDKGNPFSKEYRIIRHNDKSEIWVHGMGSLVQDKEGGPMNMHGIIQDITEHHKEEQKIRQLANLYAILTESDQAITQSRDEKELFEKICRDVIHFKHIKMAWIGLVNPETKLVEVVASCGTGTEYLKDIKISVDADAEIGQGPTGVAIREKKPCWCQDFQNDPRTMPWREIAEKNNLRAAASLPLFRGGEVVGALLMYSEEINAFDEDAQRLLVEMTKNISHALDNFDDEAERVQAEDALKKKLEEVERLNKHMIGRELKMAALKNKISELEAKTDKSKE